MSEGINVVGLLWGARLRLAATVLYSETVSQAVQAFSKRRNHAMRRLGWRGAILGGTTLAALAGGFFHLAPDLLFFVTAPALILYAKVIGDRTEGLAQALGPSLGALLGATFGNSVELIIAVIALKDGLYEVVKASVLGSILANLLLTLGVCMIVGGAAKKVQHFSRAKAGLNSAMLFVAVVGLTMASIYAFASHRPLHAEALSIGVAIVFLLVYGLGVVFSFFTHRSFLAPSEPPAGVLKHFSLRVTVAVLLGATVAVALLSDQIVGTVEPMARQLNLSPEFIGLIFLPLIGIAPEFFSAVLFARKNQMDGSVEIAIGSSLQIALFVAPTLVVIGSLWHRPLTLVFTPTEVVVVFLATLLVSLVSLDGETHWYEGVMVTSTYVIFAMLFFLA